MIILLIYLYIRIYIYIYICVYIYIYIHTQLFTASCLKQDYIKQVTTPPPKQNKTHTARPETAVKKRARLS